MKKKQVITIFMLMTCLFYSAFKTSEKKQHQSTQSHDQNETIVREIAIGGGH